MRFGIQHFGNHQAPAPGWMVHQQPSANPEGFFFQAVARGDRFFMESMIQNGINVNARAVTGNTPAIIAAEYCQIDALFLLMEDARVDLSMANNCGFTVMHALARHGLFNVIEAVGTSFGTPANGQCVDGATPLHLAAMNGHVEACRVLVEKLHVDVTTMDREGRSALFFAAWSRNEEIVRILLNAMASNPELQSRSASLVLPVAAAFGLTTLVRDLVDTYDADINARDQRHKNSALMLAANHGHIEIVKYLDQKHADLNLKNTYGSTAAILASCEGHTNIIKYFVRKSNTKFIDFKVANKWNFTALDYAYIRHASALISILKEVTYGLNDVQKAQNKREKRVNKTDANSIKAYHGRGRCGSHHQVKKRNVPHGKSRIVHP